MTSGIYALVNTVTNLIYVGSSKNLAARRSGHFRQLKKQYHRNWKLSRDYKRHGKDSFSFLVLEICSDEILEVREDFWIHQLNSIHNGYNLKTAQRGFCGDGTRARMSKVQSARYTDPVARSVTREAVLMSERWDLNKRVAHSQLIALLWNDPAYRSKCTPKTGRIGPMTGKKHSVETREKMRQSHLRRNASQQDRGNV